MPRAPTQKSLAEELGLETSALIAPSPVVPFHRNDKLETFIATHAADLAAVEKIVTANKTLEKKTRARRGR